MDNSKRFRRYTKEDEAFIRANLNSMTNAEIGQALGRSSVSISTYLVSLRLRRESTRKYWTPEEVELFKNKYAEGLTIPELAAFFNVSINSAKSLTGNRRIRSGRTGFFPKGNRPWNFRTKGLVKSTPGMKSTQFKKGDNPKNTLHDGAITIRHDHLKTRKGRPYKWIRISEGKWVHYHRYVWEQVNGPIPKGMMITFKDGDSLNCELTNLEMIIMGENARRNYNPEKAQRCSKELTDNYVAGRIAKGDKKLREALKVAAPELIEAKRTQLKLNRKIKNERQGKTREAA